jgi:hypothetical protein
MVSAHPLLLMVPVWQHSQACGCITARKMRQQFLDSIALDQLSPTCASTLRMCMQQEHAAGLDCMPWPIMSVRLPTGLHVLFLYGCFAVLQVHLCCRVTALGSTALRPG